MTKILHVCVGGPYTDGFTYQENLLTKHHRLLGFDVVIAASPLCFGNDGQVRNAPLGRYVNEDDVTVVRLSLAKPGVLASKLKKVIGLRELLVEEAPDIIFQHGIQTLAASDTAWYLQQHKDVRLYVDNHVDLGNMGGRLHRLLLDKTLWRHEGRLLVPYASAFYGVLPARVRTLTEVYGIPADLCQLLVMGYDDCPDATKTKDSRENVSSWLYESGIEGRDLVLCTGGKIDSYKREVWTLLRFVASGGLPSNMRLVLFGSVDANREEELNELCDSSEQLSYFGWADQYQMNALIDRADACVFPGRHSVLWEQVAGQGKPLFIRTLCGYEHLDRGGNVWCLGDVVDDISLGHMVEHIANTKEFSVQRAAARNASASFRYSQIARASIGLIS